MVIDTSALLAILEDEPERHAFNAALAGAPVRRLSAANYVEACIVIQARRGAAAVDHLTALIARAGIEIVAVDGEQAVAAADAYRRFGKGQHTAGLNYGDLFAYALARTTGEPLLFKGEDFARTDVLPARLSPPTG